MSRILDRSSMRYLARHRWQAFLSLTGIAIGVAVVVSMDLANESARRAFDLSMDSVVGRATHHIVGGPSGLPEELYRALRVERGIRDCAPVVEDHVTVEGDAPRTFMLMGVDPFAEKPFRPYLSGGQGVRGDDFRRLLVTPGALLLSEENANLLGIRPGDVMNLKIGGKRKRARLAGVLNPEGEGTRLALQNLILSDLASAQELLDRPGRLSRIDLIQGQGTKGESPFPAIESFLPPGVDIIRSDARSRATEQMIHAFRINLNAMSLLALIVGMFLIYNTMTFSVMQRRVMLGLLRSLGATRRQIFFMISREALWLGGVGTVAGLLLGIVMGKGLVGLVSRTINDLYFVVSVQGLSIPPWILAKGFAMGVCATLAASCYPAWEATRSPPVSVMRRSSQESKVREKIPALTVAGLMLLAAGALVLCVPTRSILFGYAGILPLILGFALLTPAVILWLAPATAPCLGTFFGLLGRMAARGVESQISRTAVAIAALGLAVAATVGVGTTIASFRRTVVHWLDRRLEADVYVSAPSLISRQNDGTLDPALAGKIARLPGFRSMNYYREVQILEKGRTYRLVGASVDGESRDRFRFKEGESGTIWSALDMGTSVMISEPFAFRHGLSTGDTLRIPTDRGRKIFAIAGIYYDYGSDIGSVTMAHAQYMVDFDDPFLSGIAVFLEEGTPVEDFTDRVRSLAGADQELLVRTNRALRELSIDIFDRTFVIANVLQILAVAVAFIGILSSLMALQLERSRELAVLRANGLLPGQLWGLVSLQTALMGLAAGFLSLPLGNVLAWILIYVINRRSFGWTLQFELEPGVFIQAVILSVVSAFVAGLYPAVRMARTPLAAALREE